MKKFMDWLLINAAVPAIAILVRLLGLTWKFTELSENGAEPKRGKTEQYIYGFMHAYIIPTVYTYRGRKIATIVSSHKDGEIAARAVRAFGMKTARGSSTRGGARGLLELIDYISKGYDIAITVDGPRGPRGELKDGILYLAKLTGKKAVLVGFACDNKYRLKSWDKMEIPKLFSRGGFVFGRPFEVPGDITDEQLRELKALKTQELEHLNEEAQRLINAK